MLEYLEEEFLFVVVLPVIGFVVNLIIRSFHIRNIRKLYGDGSGGFIFDLKEEDIEETNRKNHPVTGDYDESLAVKTRTGIYVGENTRKPYVTLGFPM